MDVAFSVVRYATAHGTREGVATNWLQRLLAPLTSGTAPLAGDRLRLPIYLRRGGAFQPPQDLTKPLIMIGPGTGVAPFRSVALDASSLACGCLKCRTNKRGRAAVFATPTNLMHRRWR